MSNQGYMVDKRLVRDSFDRAAARYDEVAVLQREVGERLLTRLDEVRLGPRTVLDLGAGTGVCSAALVQRYPAARVVVSDLAPAMLAIARQRLLPVPRALQGGRLAARAGRLARSLHPAARRSHFVAADAESLPFADASVDLLFSNLAIQWCPDLDRTFAEFRRVLAPGGLLSFTTFGPDTLHELRDSWSRVDGFNHVNLFVDMHDIGGALMRAGLAEPVLDVDRMTVTYDHALDLMRDLKTLGAHNVTSGRRHGVTGRRRLQGVVDAYEEWRRDGVLPATYEVVYGHAWAGRTPPASLRSEVRVPFPRLAHGEYKPRNQE